MADILVVDDDGSIASAFEHFLRVAGHESRLASNAEDALRLIEERLPQVVFMDIRMPGIDGLEALEKLRRRFPDLCVVMMTAYGTSQTSIDAIRAGAFEYVTKPLDVDELQAIINKALAVQQAKGRTDATAVEDPAGPPIALVGDTPAMQEVYKMIGRLSTNDVSALVVGERGTGRRLVVATIHRNSARRLHPFVTLECGALPADMLEKELFGGNAGTVYLKDVEALPLTLQARLATALNDPAAGPSSVRTMPRIIASTETDIAELVRTGAFHEALYDALSVIALRLPPLRERREDIAALVRHLITRFNNELNRSIKGIDDEVAAAFQEHAWPGNVGQLQRVLKRACIVARADVITLDDLGDSLNDSRSPARQDLESTLARAVGAVLQDRLVQASGGSPYHAIIDAVETTLVKEALVITSGNQVKAADLLGVNRATLRKKAPTES
jgi:DNA-binding NtrC family response regulator